MPHRKFVNGAGKPVVALDIDGTLGDYHGHFLRFAEPWFGRKFPDPAEINPGLPLWKFMGVSRAKYRECKLAYRQGGIKRSMPCYRGAEDLTKYLRLSKAEIWICSTRPYLRLDNIDPDTREWLRRNRITYDSVIFGDDKYAELRRQVGAERIVAIVEDLPEQISKSRSQFVTNVYVRDQPYNQDVSEGIATRIYDNFVLLEYLLNDIQEWRQRNAKSQQD